MSNQTLQITGMTCGHCAQAVTRALAAVPGVESAKVDLSSGRAQVAGSATAEDLMAAVGAAGYEARLALGQA